MPGQVRNPKNGNNPSIVGVGPGELPLRVCYHTCSLLVLCICHHACSLLVLYICYLLSTLYLALYSLVICLLFAGPRAGEEQPPACSSFSMLDILSPCMMSPCCSCKCTLHTVYGKSLLLCCACSMLQATLFVDPQLPLPLQNPEAAELTARCTQRSVNL